MPKVKKYTKGEMYVISFGEALAEILWHNYHPVLTKKNEEIVRQQLLTEVRVNTQTAAYYLMEMAYDAGKREEELTIKNVEIEKGDWE